MMILKTTLFKAMLCLCPVLLMGCGSSGSSSSESAKVSEQADSSEESAAKESLDTIIATEDDAVEDSTSENTLVEDSISETPILSGSIDNGAIVNESILEEESTQQTDTSSNTDDLLSTPESEQASEVDLYITWGDNSDNEVEFIIERRIQSNVDYGTTYYVAENTTSYNDEGVQVGETYCYRVSASNSIGKSSSSEQCIEL
ncbi:hypothetical protein [uncultured Psychromonas sp.]|uniref:hypothetical protein n=1 Tax=uncultured Psychromonas sp. TaxID=173974 RepID=UPI002604A360|nr:hypothetical protein [uncultured Psychromonas sp.]